jgi:glycosyltransferase involved in cell wall biosynthesis
LLALPAGFPHPDKAAIGETVQRLAATPSDAILLIDGLAFGALPGSALTQIRRRIVALVHHPLCLETGLDTLRADALREGERAALTFAARVVATSAATVRLLGSEFGVPPGRLAIAAPGCDPMPRARGTMRPPRLLSVGAVIPRKGYDMVLAALAGLDVDWGLTIVGSTDRGPEYADTIRTLIAELGLGARIELTGAVPDSVLREQYAQADLYVSASRHEGYGMAVAAALSAGLPLVWTNVGALRETVPPEAGLIVPPDNPSAMRQALCRMLECDTLRGRCAAASWRTGQRLPRWNETARHIRVVLESVAAENLPPGTVG